MLKRIVNALESIATSLLYISNEIKSMREEQTKIMIAAQNESKNAPNRILEMVEMFKNTLIKGGPENGA